MLNYSKTFQTEFTHNTLRLPHLSLQGCVRCFLTRDVEQTTERDFKSIFPTCPYPVIVWTIKSKRELLNKTGQAWTTEIPQQFLYYGAQPNWVTCKDEPGLSLFSLVMQPDAPHTLFGFDASEHVDNVRNGYDIFPTEWHELSQRIIEAPNHDIRQNIIEAFLEPKWMAARKQMHPVAHSAVDWLNNAINRTAISKPGSSIRQLERRFKRAVGLPKRQLKTIDRGEKMLLVVKEALEQGISPDWAKLAQQLGYYDQAHFCNEVKRFTDHTPDELTSMAYRNEDALWVFHLW